MVNSTERVGCIGTQCSTGTRGPREAASPYAMLKSSGIKDRLWIRKRNHGGLEGLAGSRVWSWIALLMGLTDVPGH